MELWLEDESFYRIFVKSPDNIYVAPPPCKNHFLISIFHNINKKKTYRLSMEVFLIRMFYVVRTKKTKGVP